MGAVGEAQREPMRLTGCKTDRLDITVLMGGAGDEREVSLASGRAVADALTRAGHKVVAADIGPDDLSALDRKEADVIFIALHGAWGESGELQRICEDRGLVYVGSGPAASAAAMDKAVAKDLFRQAGLATPEWAVIDRGADAAAASRQSAAVGLPCAVKPVGGGSSVDLTIAENADDRDRAARAVAARHGRALVERFVAGREMTVGILGEAALPIVEIIAPEGRYDYEAKYHSDRTKYVPCPDLSEAAALRLQADATVAHRALGCRDFSRADFILDESGLPWVLEVNTIPGFTSHSLLPKAAAAAGIAFEQLCDRIARLALARAGR